MPPKHLKIVAHGKTSKFPGSDAPTLEDFKRIRKVLNDQAVPKDGRYYRIAIHPDSITPKFREQCKRWGWKIVEETKK